jgi:hypothetical protein
LLPLRGVLLYPYFKRAERKGKEDKAKKAAFHHWKEGTLEKNSNRYFDSQKPPNSPAKPLLTMPNKDDTVAELFRLLVIEIQK